MMNCRNRNFKSLGWGIPGHLIAQIVRTLTRRYKAILERATIIQPPFETIKIFMEVVAEAGPHLKNYISGASF